MVRLSLGFFIKSSTVALGLLMAFSFRRISSGALSLLNIAASIVFLLKRANVAKIEKARLYLRWDRSHLNEIDNEYLKISSYYTV